MKDGYWGKRDYREYDRNRRDEKSRSFYHSKEWERKRAHVLGLDEGLDVYLYMKSGEAVPADTVHHIEPLRDCWEKRLDDDNLVSLSHGTHAEIEQMYKNDKAGAMEELKRMTARYRAMTAAGTT
jgi:hypothetical protein